MKSPLLLVFLACLLTGCSASDSDHDATGTESSPSQLGASGADNSQSEGIVLGRTSDDSGQPHALVLNLAPDVEESLLQTNQLFAVVSGSTKFSVTGDAAVGAWRFVVDSSATGDAAPIVVIKNANGSVKDLAGDPSKFTAGTALNEDVGSTSDRLTALIATAISKSDLEFYSQLARTLQDPVWNGVMVFNASVSAAPDEVQGQTIGALGDPPIAAFNIGFEASPLSGSPGAFFGTVDYTPASSDSGSEYLRALFANSALISFETGKG